MDGNDGGGVRGDVRGHRRIGGRGVPPRAASLVAAMVEVGETAGAAATGRPMGRPDPRNVPGLAHGTARSTGCGVRAGRFPAD